MKNKKNTLTLSVMEFNFGQKILVILACILPLVVHVKTLNLAGTPYFNIWTGQTTIFDVFNWYKAVVLMVLSLALVIFLLLHKKKNIEQMYSDQKSTTIILIFLFICITLSAFVSNNRYIAFWGMVDRFEGTLVWYSYFIIFVSSYILLNNKKSIQLLLRALSITSIIISILGLMQFNGINVFFDTPLKYLVLSDLSYQTLSSWKDMAFGTLGNPNYLGSYCALVIPLLVGQVAEERGLWRKIFIASLVLVLLALWASGSLAAIVALCGTIFLFVLVWTVNKYRLNYKKVAAVIIFSMVFLSIFGLLYLNETGFFNKQHRSNYLNNGYLKVYQVVNNQGILQINNVSIKIEWDEKDKNFEIANNENKKIIMSNTGYGNFDGSLNGVVVLKGTYYRTSKNCFVLRITIDGKNVHFNYKDGYIHLSDKFGRTLNQKAPRVAGFEGYERVGSQRGYIWSRTIPLLSNSIIYGVGADNFITTFPRDEIFAKAFVFGNSDMIVDKPHNLYLKFGIEFGCIALLVFIYLNIRIINKSIIMLVSKKNVHTLSIACSITGFLLVGLFNDSVISVTALYWIMLGALAASEA